MGGKKLSIVSVLVESGPQYFVNGIIIGSILSLGAIGLTTTYRILGFPNFAHGDFLSFGAFMVLMLNLFLGIPLVLSLFGAVAISILLVVSLEEALWKPLRKKGAGSITMLIASIGLALFLRNSILFAFGGGPRNYDLPRMKGFSIMGISLTKYDLLVIIISFALMFLIYFILNRTRLGKAMRALADNKDLARVSGINVDQVIMGTWIIGMSLAVVAGLFYGLATTVRPTMGWTLLLPMFAAVILGGIGNPYGAMIGGLTVGVSQELSVLFIPPEYKAAVSFVLIIILLLWRPRGLLGG